MIKSFLTVRRPSELLGICEFSHFYNNKSGRKRECRGLIIPFHHVLTFIGNIDQGEAAEIIVFRKQKTPQNNYDGLIITFSDDADPVCGRIILTRSDHFRHSDSGSEVRNIQSFSGKELDLVNRARNRVHFVLEKSVKKKDRNLIQSEIVSEIANLLRVDGDDLFKFDDGTVFNPASDNHYTFNSSIGLPKDNEK